MHTINPFSIAFPFPWTSHSPIYDDSVQESGFLISFFLWIMDVNHEKFLSVGRVPRVLEGPNYRERKRGGERVIGSWDMGSGNKSDRSKHIWTTGTATNTII